MLLSRTEVVQLIEELDEIRTMIRDNVMDGYYGLQDERSEESEIAIDIDNPYEEAMSNLYEIVERLDAKLSEEKDEASKQDATAFGEVICGVASQSESEAGTAIAKREPGLWDLLYRGR